ncbi:hypothetical protein FE257_010564 [Aspergillus nanangensis]|uniref:CUE domain protein n=1 Tax=Aspergillus nanangensis TaxID=2582783 RepID=A0AAD4CIG1_ASPNN|nr:hypothetical protein FE257_010564 [Aspergillus nanangensis]
MDRFLSKKRPRSTPSPEDDSTDVKLAQLASLFPEISHEALLDILISCGGSVETAISTITASTPTKKRPTPGAPAVQTSLTSHVLSSTTGSAPPSPKRRALTRKGKTLHLFSPKDVAAYTPCTIIHNFLPTDQANALLLELLDESKHFSRYRFQLFDRTVESPHSSSVYISTPEEYKQHTSEYTYGGTYRSNVRQITPHMQAVSSRVQQSVNKEVNERIRNHYPGGKKLQYQSPQQWMPNAAFVNCYDGPAESVGFHADELTYLGPRAVIGSLSLGVEREFRVRRIVPRNNEEEAEKEGEEDEKEAAAAAAGEAKVEAKPKPEEGERALAIPNLKSTCPRNSRADEQGQIAIHLPHNSLLVMHAEMQEEWKHAIVPAQTISPHPVSGNRRINITYRWYRESLHPRNTPRCRCGMPTILRCVQRKRETRGRYMWMCYAGFAPGKKSCGFFQWAEFDDDGEPSWTLEQKHDDAPLLKNFVNG